MLCSCELCRFPLVPLVPTRFPPFSSLLCYHCPLEGDIYMASVLFWPCRPYIPLPFIWSRIVVSRNYQHTLVELNTRLWKWKTIDIFLGCKGYLHYRWSGNSSHQENISICYEHFLGVKKISICWRMRKKTNTIVRCLPRQFNFCVRTTFVALSIMPKQWLECGWNINTNLQNWI